MMRQSRYRLVFALAIGSVCFEAPAQQPSAVERLKPAMHGTYFVPNGGQWSGEDIAFGLKSQGLDVAFRPSSLTVHLSRINAASDRSPSRTLRSQIGFASAVAGDIPELIQRCTVGVSFPGSNDVLPVGADLQPAGFNYCVGGEDRQRVVNLPSFRGIVYEDLYNGIDLQVKGGGGLLKYEFHVAPGADYSRIRIACTGIEPLCLDADGGLRMVTALGTLVDKAPIAWQNFPSGRRPLPARFAIEDDSTYRLLIDGPVDPGRELVIDPEVQWMTYLGGSSEETGSRIVQDASGNTFMVGHTFSQDFEGSTNGHHPTHPLDAYIAKVNSSGELQWVTYLGGSGYDEAIGVGVDGAGNAFVAGNTVSTDFDGHQNTHHGGTDDAYVSKVNSSGVVQWTTFLGGSAGDFGYDISVDAMGNSVVAGRCRSNDIQERTNTYRGGPFDAVAFGVDSAGTPLWATYLGGSAIDAISAIDRDSQGNLLVTGYTNSTNFEGANNNSHGGLTDAFVAKLNSSGTLQWATYLGGGDREESYDVAVNAAGDAFVAAYTDSSDFEGRNNSFLFEDGAVVRVNAAGVLQWMTYVGGTADDGVIGVAVDASGDAIIAGYTFSADLPGRTNEIRGGQDAFIGKVSSTGNLAWTTFVGGSDSDDGAGILVDGAGSALLSGSTLSDDFEGAGNAAHGDQDAFLARLSLRDGPDLSVDATCPSGGPISISWSGASGGGTIVLIFARNKGSFRIPANYPCAGTLLGLGSNQIRNAYQGSAGQNGSRTLNSTTGAGSCGGYLQLLDLTTCSTSNIARIE